MKTSKLLFIPFLLCLLAAVAMPVQADGIIIPDPTLLPIEIDPMSQLIIRYHHVEVEIDQQIAVTRIDQVFYNPNEWAVEGTYIFPIPLDAAVDDFALWMDGEPVRGEVLDAEDARQMYEQIVSQLQDPALLEYIGQGCVQASIFPIQPGEEQRIELQYSQTLTAEQGLVRYVYPLSTEKFSLNPLESVSVSVDVKSETPIRAAYSSSHTIDVERLSDSYITATYEGTQVTPDTDFVLYYSLGETAAVHLLSFRDPGDIEDDDGFFMMLLAPPIGENHIMVEKDLILILDRSGSMDGEKFEQALEAVRYILHNLNEGDRFYLAAFSSSYEPYSYQLETVNNVPEALDWVDGLSASGSTDINRALLEAAAVFDEERPTYLIFLTDGLPTEGVVDSGEILRNFEDVAPDGLRLFPFGVGYDVDTFLLDSLSSGYGGLSTYVLPDEDLNERLSSFYEKISTPVMTDLGLDFGDVMVYDLYPYPLPDLYSGSQVVVVGRYREGGMSEVVLSGVVNGNQEEMSFADIHFANDSSPYEKVLASIPRLWATRKIGYLLNSIRINGPEQETIDQIVELSIRYGIVTPYTSYLVTEEMPLGAESRDEMAQNTFQAMQTAPAEASGQAAVEKADEESELIQSDVALALGEEDASSVQIVNSSTFVLVDGVWMDSRYDPGTMQTQKIAFLSEEYFELARQNADIAAAFALGENVIVLSGGKAYEVIDGEPGAYNPTVDNSDMPLSDDAQPTESIQAGIGSTPVPDPIDTEAVVATEAAPRSSSNVMELAVWLSVAILGIGAGTWLLIKSRKD